MATNFLRLKSSIGKILRHHRVYVSEVDHCNITSDWAYNASLVHYNNHRSYASEIVHYNPNHRNSEEYFVKLLQEKIKLVESKAQKYATNPGRIHASLVKNGIRSDQVLCKQLRLYGSSGYIVETKRFFYDCYNSGAAGIAVWNAGIASLATLGEGLQAINMFEDIPQSLNKTHATYWNVLLACSHAGETSYAHYLLGRVFKRLGIEPSIELIGTYLGGLARNGELDEAVEYVKSMIYKPNQEIIVSILTPLLLLKNLRSILKHKESLITLRKLLIGNFPKMGCNGNRMLKFRDKGHKEDPEYSM